MSKELSNRIIIYPKDVEQLTGRSARTSRQIIYNLKKKLGKSKNSFITIDEFANHFGIDPKTIRELIF